MIDRCVSLAPIRLVILSSLSQSTTTNTSSVPTRSTRQPGARGHVCRQHHHLHPGQVLLRLAQQAEGPEVGRPVSRGKVPGDNAQLILVKFRHKLIILCFILLGATRLPRDDKGYGKQAAGFPVYALDNIYNYSGGLYGAVADIPLAV